MRAGPPRLATQLLAILLPREQRAEILGDLAESYEFRVKHSSRWQAGLWYWKQTLTTPAWLRGEEGVVMVGLSWQEARYAVRGFLRKPGFTLITVLTLALGIGANTAIFSVVDGVLLEPLPFPEPDQLVSVGHLAPGIYLPPLPNAPGSYRLFNDDSRSFAELALLGAGSRNITGDGPPERISIGTATPSLFRVLGVRAALGRTFTEEEGLPGGSKIALLSHGLWIDRYGGDPDIVGRLIQIDGASTEVVGVMPEGFAFPNKQARLWTPIRLDPAGTNFGGFNYPSIGRLKEGATAESAQRELNALLPRLSERHEALTPGYLANLQLSVTVHPYIDDVVGGVRTALWIVMATVGFVLLIACANVANLLMVRAESRSKEVAIRTAVGANRGHLLVRFMTESVLLAVTGGMLGLLLAHQGLRVLVSMGTGSLPRLDQIGIDGSVLAFTAGVTLLAAVVFGAIPALRQRGTQAAGILRDGTRGSTTGRESHHVRKILVASQVAFALILLVGSGLMLRSFRELQQVDVGFDDESVLTFNVALADADYPGVEAPAAFHQELLERLGALPGVEAVGAVTQLPLSGLRGVNALTVEGHPVDPDVMPPAVEGRSVTPGFFAALSIPLVSGRMLEQADVDTRSGAVLVSQRVVDVFFPNEDPLGRLVALAQPESRDGWSHIVGVVGDVHAKLMEEPLGTIYFPLVQGEGVTKGWLSRSMSYTLKTSVPPTSILPGVRAAVQEIDANLPLARARPLDDLTRAAQARMAFTMLLLGIAATVGLLLGSVGLYGVVSYVTAQRTGEIGLRMAMGAERGSVQRMIVRQGLAVTGAGLAIGLGAAYVLSRFLETILFRVDARDPLTFGTVTLVLLLVSLLATWLPAARAAGTDPAEALRCE